MERSAEGHTLPSAEIAVSESDESDDHVFADRPALPAPQPAPPKPANNATHAIGFKQLVVPAAALLLFAVRGLRRRAARRRAARRAALDAAGAEAEGTPVEVELPRRRGPVLPFAPPPPLRTTLLHATFRVPVAELWSHLFSNSSAALVAFHERLGDTGAGLTPWRQAAAGGGGPPVRVLRFSTPVRNPMVSSPVSNREELTAARLAAGGFVVDAACTSAGAPFAASFVNRLQWAAAAEGGGTRLRVTGECNFVTPVWGPIKGTIERESIKGMTRAYAMLHSILAQRFGLLEAAGQPAAPPSAARPPLFDFARGQQMTPAVVAAFFAVVVLLWRMVLLDALALQALRRLVPSPGGRGG